MNRILPRRRLCAFAAASLLVPQAARARSFAAFERELSQQERFFQVMDQQAPPFELSDPNGHSAGLAELRGKVIVLNFIYTLCPDICPLESERVAAIQRMVNPTKLRDQVRFVSITADPVRDTPPVMKAYGAQHGLDPANWIFLTSGADHPDTAVALSRAYHNRFLREADGSITHGVIFHVIDGAGRWRGNFHGLDWKPERLVMLMTELANHDHAGKEPSSSFWKRITDLL